jgi:transposase
VRSPLKTIHRIVLTEQAPSRLTVPDIDWSAIPSVSGAGAMHDLIWLRNDQMTLLEPYFRLLHGIARVDNRKVLSGIVFVVRKGFAGMIREEPAFGLDTENSEEFGEVLKAKKIKVGILPRSNWKIQHAFSKTMCKQRNTAERMFGIIRNWQRIATGYNRSARTFFSVICVAGLQKLSHIKNPETKLAARPSFF